MPERMNKPSQKDQILHLLRQGWACSQDLQLVCWRYSARLHDLRTSGVQIEDKDCDCTSGHPNFRHWRVMDGNQKELF